MDIAEGIEQRDVVSNKGGVKKGASIWSTSMYSVFNFFSNVDPDASSLTSLSVQCTETHSVCGKTNKK